VASELESPSDQRVLAIASALQRGVFILSYASCVCVNYIDELACTSVCESMCVCVWVLVSHESTARETICVLETVYAIVFSWYHYGVCVSM
jgi:hypothetical protein